MTQNAEVAAELAELRELKATFQEELMRLRQQQPVQPIGPSKTTRRKVNTNGVRMFDPSTGTDYDQAVSMEMWRPDLTRSCPCGQVRYAHTQRFDGEQAIEHATHAVIDQKSGAVAMQGWRGAYSESGECLIPDELCLDDDKRAHLHECTTDHESQQLSGEYDEEMREFGRKLAGSKLQAVR